MAKIAILGDTHLDIKHYSDVYHNYFEKFYNEIFFPTIKERNIECVIQTGDLFDNKKQINFNSLDRIKEYFLNKFEQNKINLITFPGNHDCPFWKKSLKNNAQSIILKGYKYIKSYDKPSSINIDGLDIDLYPWICQENEKEILDYIKNSQSRLCIGHFELSGFPVYRGYELKEGLSSIIFSNYEKVISGHYHTQSQKGNIQYIGTPYHLTRHDTNEVKGFYILDTDTLEMEFIQNPFQLFRSIEWNDSESVINPKDFKDTYLKVIVKSKNDENKFISYIKQCENYVYDIDIIENLELITEDESEDNNVEYEDTKEVMSKYVKSIKNKELDINKLELMVLNLYDEALTLEKL